MSKQIKLTSFTSSFKIESESSFLAMRLDLFIIDGTESVEFSVIKFDFILTADSFYGAAKSLNDDCYFIQVNNDVFIERLSFILEVSNFLLDLLHSTVFHITFVAFETDLLLKNWFDVGEADKQDFRVRFWLS